jgi:DMSO/TMAO reductase YedYZ molybdopterin-dependent catalytic subunit
MKLGAPSSVMREQKLLGNAEWTGVPLSVLLERAGLAQDACEIVLEGPDRGVPKEGALPGGPVSYARGCLEQKHFSGKY